MYRFVRTLTLLAALCSSCVFAWTQPAPTTFTNDPAKVRMYTYPNGFRLFVGVNTQAPRVQAIIAAHTGSKNDPPDATGLAHYLEHMLFKGTDRMGTIDAAHELPMIQQIEDMYEKYRTLTNEQERKTLYHAIDSVSGVAARYAVANEYDKICQALACTGTNAFTSTDITAYHNDVPANRLQAYLKMEAERFRKPVLRLFHTELEAVYEEKNMSLDEDMSLVYDTMNLALFPTHTYGTQSTIGTVQHLKNPSMKRIREYYDAMYQPSNMIMILCGDVNADVVAKWVGESFGAMPSRPAPVWTVAPLPAITKPIVKHLTGPDAEMLQMAYRWPGASHKDIPALIMVDMLLANGKAGLIDLNLNQAQRVLEAGSSPSVMADYSMHIFTGRPKEGQSLEEVQKLLLEQVELVKQGKFADWLLPATVRNLDVSRQKELESHTGQAFFILEHLSQNLPYQDYVSQLNAVRNVTRADVIRVANQYYADNYVVIFKHSGERTDLEKVTKPEITPVTLNRDTTTAFAAEIMTMPAQPVKPVFMEYDRDIVRAELRPDIPVLAVRNTTNNLFTLEYRIDIGTYSNRLINLALGYLEYLGTKQMSADELHREEYKLAISVNAGAGDDESSITVSGTDDTFKDGVSLIEKIFATVQADNAKLAELKQAIHRSREDALKDKGTLLRGGLRPYAIYGKDNPTMNQLSSKELDAVTSEQLIALLKTVLSYPHKVLYYGPRSAEEVAAIVRPLHIAPAKLLPAPPVKKFTMQPMDKPQVYFMHHDMVQAEIITLGRSLPRYDSTRTPVASLFSTYFDGGMGSIVFQTLRESKALAYGTGSSVMAPRDTVEPYMMTGYIGTQADKTIEAIDGLRELMHDLPRIPSSLDYARTYMKQNIETQRVQGLSIIRSYLAARKFGRTTDGRKATYASLDNLSMEDVQKFYDTAVKDRYNVLLVLGHRDKVNMKALEKYGTVTILEKKDVFPYAE